MTLLRLDQIAASYGAAQALFGVDLHLEEGEVLALMGRNGMGKSTTIRVICRLMKHSAGHVQFLGRDMAQVSPHEAARAGLGLVPEGRRIFASLTVRENLMAAARPGLWDFAAVTRLFPRLKEREGQIARHLSGGEQQMLAIGRALMTNPRLMLLDEATEGLAPVVRQEIWDALDAVRRDTGMSLIVVDKSLTELGRIADRATILERGQSVWTGSMSDVAGDVANTYLGV
ncbi:ABC transporter ATP-binding protein [Tateyamaria omphalii]|uniref:ABC transporter ATP-binding protein n=1 Tax=Tateyamaria omphalii TaxID=299262 RepID=UPI001C997F61|nr:ABC transporter ATP-binding protein [Tateyamaria omphalii]MBY5934060.1 ABC transporter ATP-binding protein [Tateyamaria omphalii]